MREDPSVPELLLQYQVERTAESRLVKGQSGKPVGRDPGCLSHAACAAQMLLDGEAEAATWRAV
jgi:hypothetical protein